MPHKTTLQITKLQLAYCVLYWTSGCWRKAHLHRNWSSCWPFGNQAGFPNAAGLPHSVRHEICWSCPESWWTWAEGFWFVPWKLRSLKSRHDIFKILWSAIRAMQWGGGTGGPGAPFLGGNLVFSFIFLSFFSSKPDSPPPFSKPTAFWKMLMLILSP